MNKNVFANLLADENLVFIVSSTVLAIVLFIQAFHPAWQSHLQTDVIIHQQQVQEYWQTGSWQNISFQEYQPGALWFFMVSYFLESFQNNYSVYLAATLFINALLLISHGLVYARFRPNAKPWLLLIMLAAMGPILLYRFDLIVSLLTISGWILFMKRQVTGAGLLLGLAIAIKLYPIVIVPILVFEFIRINNRRLILNFLIGLSTGLALVLIPFLLFGGNIQDVSESLRGYQIKPVGLDSMWGSAATILAIGTGQNLVMDNAHGIHGLVEPTTIFSLSFYNLIWILPTGVVFIWLLWRYRLEGYRNPLIPLVVLTVFTLTAKVLNPQYLWWFLSFLPLIPKQVWTQTLHMVILITVIVSLIFTQLTYPLNYTASLDWYYDNSVDVSWFIIALSRNALLLIFLAAIIYIATRKFNSHLQHETGEPGRRVSASLPSHLDKP